ncbi:uncharacterized protein [Typha angustifolia]|uniref:uncharacterized protein n=1 Tax=Typha angustifolia TaxID=59011 RepID=UPI003C2D48F6
MEPTNVVVEEPIKEEKKEIISKEAAELTVELVQSSSEEKIVAVEKAATMAAVVPVDPPPSANQEVVETIEATTGTFEASLDTDASAHDTQVRAVRDGGEISQVTEGPGETAQASHAEVLEHRWSCWDCCGLVDVFRTV